MHSSLTDETAIAKTELNQYLEAQKSVIAPEYPKDRIATQINEINVQEIELALKKGQLYLQRRKVTVSLDGFKAWLKQQGMTLAVANKYIKLYKTFAEFPVEQIGKIALTTLFALCGSRYKKLLSKLRGFGVWTEVKLQELMKSERFKNKAAVEPRRASPVSGWKRMPSGGGRYYALNIHNDEVGVLLEKIAKKRNCLPDQVIEMALLNSA